MAVREDLQQSGLHIRRLKTRLHDSASRAEALRRDREEAQSGLKQLGDDHPDWVQDNSRQSTGYFFLVAGVTAVYFLDIMLFGPTAEMLSEKAFYGSPVMAWVARLLVPAAILLAEISIALQIFFARRHSETYYTSNKACQGWIFIGILFALVMPSFVVGTNLVQASFESQSMQTGLRWQLFGLVILAIVMHVPIIFGGRLAHEAKAFFTFKAKHRSLQRRVQQYNKEYGTEAQSFRSDFDSFYDLLNRHRQTFQDNYDPGPFDSRTRRFSREIYGYDVIQPAFGAGASQAPQNSSFDQGNQGQGQDQMRDEFADVDSRVREEESEVRA